MKRYIASLSVLGLMCAPALPVFAQVGPPMPSARGTMGEPQKNQEFRPQGENGPRPDPNQMRGGNPSGGDPRNGGNNGRVEVRPLLDTSRMNDRLGAPQDQRQNTQNENMQRRPQQKSGDEMMDRGSGVQDQNMMPQDDTRMSGDDRQQGVDMEERDAQMEQRRFEDMKRGASQFTKGVEMMKKQVDKMKGKLTACGIGLPSDLILALESSKALITKLQSAKTADELQESMEDLQDTGEAMREWGPKLGQLTRLCEMFKRADQDIKRLESDGKRLAKQAASNKKIDFTSFVKEYTDEVAKMKDTLKSSRSIAKDDPETALESLEDDFYGEMDNVMNIRRTVEMAANMAQGLKQAKKELTRFTTDIKRLKTKKIDTAEYQGMLNDLTKKFDELTVLVAKKGVRADDIEGALEEVHTLRQDLQDKIQEALGGDEFVPKIKEEKGFDFQVPKGFEKDPADTGMLFSKKKQQQTEKLASL